MNITRADVEKVAGAGLLLIFLVLLATLSLYASVYTVILLTSILMYVVLTMSWVLFSGATGYISLAPAAFLASAYIRPPFWATSCLYLLSSSLAVWQASVSPFLSVP